jgi:hypothetical protein
MASDPRGSDEQGISEVVRDRLPQDAGVTLARLENAVDTEAVPVNGNLAPEPMDQQLELDLIEEAFKHRLLNALAMRLAQLCHPPKALSAGGRVGGDIVGDHKLHA